MCAGIPRNLLTIAALTLTTDKLKKPTATEKMTFYSSF